MKKIFIRTNFGDKVGLGHLFRMKKFADSFLQKKKIIFLLDNYNDIIPKILSYKCIFLYDRNRKYFSQKEDANIVKKILDNYNVELLVVDDYRFDQIWEKTFYKRIKLLVFDDNNSNKHKCDFLVDAKWDGEKTYYRYAKLLNKNTIKILGPQYSILDINKIKYNKKNKNFIILFYLGGGGNFKNYKNFFLNLIEQTKNEKIQIILIKGPFARNYEKLFFFLKNFSNIKIEINNLDIDKILPIVDLYIGVSSSIIYKLNYYNIPSILFSTTKNQNNSFEALGDLGFYFFLKKKDFIRRCQDLSKFIVCIINNYSIIKNINKNRIKIDTKGCERIKNLIFDQHKYQVIYKRIEKKPIFQNDGIYRVNDNQINFYLYNRNLISNRINSGIQKKIDNLDHYLWWFNEKKKLFYLIRDNKIRLFFFHKIINIKNSYYYYGGWFKTKNVTTIGDVISVVKWQILTYKKYKWIALIRKKNLFVKKINLYLGFKKINLNKKYRSFFKDLNIRKFDLFIK